jgi:hypothetical protein
MNHWLTKFLLSSSLIKPLLLLSLVNLQSNHPIMNSKIDFSPTTTTNY